MKTVRPLYTKSLALCLYKCIRHCTTGEWAVSQWCQVWKPTRLWGWNDQSWSAAGIIVCNIYRINPFSRKLSFSCIRIYDTLSIGRVFSLVYFPFSTSVNKQKTTLPFESIRCLTLWTYIYCYFTPINNMSVQNSNKYKVIRRALCYLLHVITRALWQWWFNLYCTVHPP